MKIFKTLRKRGLALFLVLTMCFSMIQTTAFAAESGHVHNEPGYTCTKVNQTCTLPEHTHGPECYRTETPQCSEADAHQHVKSCYGEDGALTCENPGAHQHTDDCYVSAEPQCGKEEHTHEDGCYDWHCVKQEAGNEVPAEVQAFLDAAAALPDASTVTKDNAETVGAQADAALALYNALGPDYQAREDVSTAKAGVDTVKAAVETALDNGGENEVPVEVKAFLDAVAAIPAVSRDNAAEVFEYVYGEVSDAYAELLGTEYENRVDVQAAVDHYAAAIDAASTALGYDDTTFEATGTSLFSRTYHIYDCNFVEELEYGRPNLQVNVGVGETWVDQGEMLINDKGYDIYKVTSWDDVNVWSTNPNVLKVTAVPSGSTLKITYEGIANGTASVRIAFNATTSSQGHGIYGPAGMSGGAAVSGCTFAKVEVGNGVAEPIEKPDAPNYTNRDPLYVFIECQENNLHHTTSNVFAPSREGADYIASNDDVVENDGTRQFPAKTHPYKCPVSLNTDYFVNLWNTNYSGTQGVHYLYETPETIMFYYEAASGKWKCSTNDLIQFKDTYGDTQYGWLMKINKSQEVSLSVTDDVYVPANGTDNGILEIQWGFNGTPAAFALSNRKVEDNTGGSASVNVTQEGNYIYVDVTGQESTGNSYKTVVVSYNANYHNDEGIASYKITETIRVHVYNVPSEELNTGESRTYTYLRDSNVEFEMLSSPTATGSVAVSDVSTSYNGSYKVTARSVVGSGKVKSTYTWAQGNSYYGSGLRVDVRNFTVKVPTDVTYTVIYNDGAGQTVFMNQETSNLAVGTATPTFDMTKVDTVTLRDGTVQPKRNGYIFTGWKLTTSNPEKDEVQATVAAADANVDRKIIYTAQWQKVTPLTVTKVAKSSDKGDANEVTEVNVGENFVYWITVTNTNSVPVTVTITDDLDTNLTFVTASDSGAHSGGTAIGTTGETKGGTVTWTNVIVPASGSKAVKLTVKANAAADSIGNTATVTWPGNGSANGTANPVKVTAPSAITGITKELVTDTTGLPQSKAYTVIRAYYDDDEECIAAMRDSVNAAPVGSVFSVEDWLAANPAWAYCRVDNVMCRFDFVKSYLTDYDSTLNSGTMNTVIADSSTVPGITEVPMTAGEKPPVIILRYNKVESNVTKPDDVVNTSYTPAAPNQSYSGSKVTIPKDGSVTLLYKITVTGGKDAAYTVEDNGATWVGGDGAQQSDGTITGTITAAEGETSGTAVIYVTKTFKDTDIGTNGKVTNSVKVNNGTPVDAATDAEVGPETTTVTIEKKFEGLTADQVDAILKGDFALEYSFDGGTTEAGTLNKDTEGMTKSTDGLTLTWTVSVPNGASLTLKEANADLDGYVRTTTYVVTPADITGGTTDTGSDIIGTDPTVTAGDDGMITVLSGKTGVTITNKYDPALTITKSVDKASVKVNNPLTYTITVTNTGTADATNVQVSDVLPTQLTNVRDVQVRTVPAEGKASPWTQLDYGTKVIGGATTVAWDLSTIAAGAAKEVRFTVTASTCGKIENNASVTSKEVTTAVKTTDPAKTVIYNLIVEKTNGGFQNGAPSAACTVPDCKSADDGSGKAHVHYTVKVTNNSGFDLYGLDILDDLTTTVTKGNAEVNTGYTLAIENVKVKLDDNNVANASMATPVANGAATHSVIKALDRSEPFAHGTTVTLTYDFVIENTDVDTLTVDLKNKATGGTWTTNGLPTGGTASGTGEDTPGVEPQAMFFTLARGGGYDISESDTSGTSTGSQTSGSVGPAKGTAYKVEHYKENSDGNYTVAETENLKGTANTTATATPKTYEGFMLDTTCEGYLPSGAITADGSLTLKLFYSRDTMRDPKNDNDDDPTNGDGIPDKYQAVVTYKVSGGYWSGTDNVDKDYVFTLWTKGTDGTWTKMDPVPVLGHTVPTGMTPDGTHTNEGAEWKQSTPEGETPVAGNVTYIYEFKSKDATVTYPKAEDGKLPDPDPKKEGDPEPEDITDTWGSGTIVIVKPMGGTWSPKTEADKWTSVGNDYERTLTAGEPVSLRENPTKPGNVFMGWEMTGGERNGIKTVTYTAQYAEDKVNQDNPSVEGSDGIPDKWQAKVVYQAVNGEITDPAKTVYVATIMNGDKMAESGTITIKEATATAKDDGYYFTGWTALPDHTGWSYPGSTNAATLEGADVSAKGGAVYTFTANFAEKTALTIEIVGNARTVTANGSEQAVTGYIRTVKEADGTVTALPTGLTVIPASVDCSAKGTAARETAYPMGLSAENFTVTGVDAGKYIVTFDVTDGWLKIDEPTPGKVTITVEFRDGDTLVGTATKEVDEGDSYDVTEEAGKIPEGYEANGPLAGDPLTGENVCSSKTIIVPVRKITVTVTWLNGYNKTPIRTETIDKGSDYSALYPANPTRSGYTFNGWSAPAVDEATGNITITAQWTQDYVPTTYTVIVRYVDENGTAIAPNTSLTTTGAYDVSGLQTVIDGYTFKTANLTLTGRVYANTTITLTYTKTEEPAPDEYTVTIKYVDEDGNPIAPDAVVDTTDGGTYDVTDRQTDIDGYTFGGADQPLTGTVTADTTITLMYAKDEEPAPDEYTITIKYVDEDGNLIAPDAVVDTTDGGTYDVTDQQIDIDGYTFGGADQPLTGTVTADATITLTYTKTEEPAPDEYTVTVRYVDEAGAEIYRSATVSTTDGGRYDVTDRQISIDGYSFREAYGALTGTITEDTTITMVYTADAALSGTHTVTWLDHDGTALRQDTVNNGEADPTADSYGTPPTRPSDGVYAYTFAFWSRTTDADGNVTYQAHYLGNRLPDYTPNYPSTPSYPSYPSTPSDPSSPSNSSTPSNPGTSAGEPPVTIIDPEVPLAGSVGLNDVDHFAYIIGYSDDTVRPLNNITRAEVATIFFRLMTDEYRTSNWATTNDFSDVAAENWFNNAISTCANAGALNGYSDGSFRPNANITRAEFAAIAARFLDKEQYTDDGTGDFSDTADHWAAKEIRLAAKAGWIQGSGNKFRPNDYITRAEVMTIVNRMLDRVPDKDHMLDTMKKWTDNPEDAWYYEAVQEATNEHAYERDELGVVETWTEILTARDWKALEDEWANANAR